MPAITTCTEKLFNGIYMGKKIFAKIAFCVAALSLAVSCGPASYRFVMERSEPSESGFNLSGKSISVVYAYPGEPFADSLLAAEISQGFVSEMEGDYFLGADAMPLFNVKAQAGADYSDKDSIVGLIMDTESDVVFMFHSFSTGTLAVSSANVVELPFTARLSVYDSMSETDTVKNYDFSDSFLWSVAGGMDRESMEQAVIKDLPNAAFRLGGEIASSFAPGWREEYYTIILYENDGAWMDAAENAVFNMDWAGAIKVWMEKADTGDIRKSSSAAYNCALGCYILGQTELAEKWLDYSDSLYKFTASSTLRNRIDAAKVR